MTAVKLVIFDVDGTLLDSRASYLSALNTALKACDVTLADDVDPLSVVGLSPEPMFRALLPQIDDHRAEQLANAYKAAYLHLRAQGKAEATATLYPGAREALNELQARDAVLLGTATGKAMRGLRAAYDAHDLNGIFVTHQTADLHPSKPHPSMIFAAMAELGVQPKDTVMIGDTSFDMEMARGADVHAIGVSWGYQGEEKLRAAGAEIVIDTYSQLIPALGGIWQGL